MSDDEQIDNEVISDSKSENLPRYCIGIDLGTTHCVAAFVDNDSDELSLTHELFLNRILEYVAIAHVTKG